MPESYRVGLVVGSLRRDAFSLKTADALVRVAPPSLTFERLEFGDLPLYNEDLENSRDLPPEWQRFRDRLKRVDCLLFVTPEYNRSIPGGLKNALDVGSRPYGDSGWEGKPAAIVSISPGAIGAFGANHHLRQALVFLDVPAMAQPEAYLGNIADRFDEHGELEDRGTESFLRSIMRSFESWVRANARVPQPV